jgi:hypothetical protein
LWLGCEYRRTEWVVQLWGEVCDGVVNTDWWSEWNSCGVRFVIGLWIQTDEVSGIILVELLDRAVNKTWWCGCDNCGVRFVIGLWIQVYGSSGMALKLVLWLCCDYMLTDFRPLLGEVCDWVENTKLRFEWNGFDVSFVIVLWLHCSCGLMFLIRLWILIYEMQGEDFNWILNTYWWSEWKNCGELFVIDMWRQINLSAWGHLNPSPYCGVERFFCRVFKFWSKLCRSLFKLM